MSGTDRVLDASVGYLKEADKLKMTAKVSGTTRRTYQTVLNKQNRQGQYTKKGLRSFSSGMLKDRLRKYPS